MSEKEYCIPADGLRRNYWSYRDSNKEKVLDLFNKSKKFNGDILSESFYSEYINPSSLWKAHTSFHFTF
jgi:hypothetical protein